MSQTVNNLIYSMHIIWKYGKPQPEPSSSIPSDMAI